MGIDGVVSGVDRPSPRPIDPEAWESGSKLDEARNNFVIPLLRDLIGSRAAKRVIDVGSGTGYVSRTLANMDRPAVHFTLLDSSEPMSMFARSATGDDDNFEVVCSDVESYSQVAPAAFDFCFSAYTVLEIEELPLFLRSIRYLIDAGTLVLILPDALADVVDNYVSRQDMIFDPQERLYRLPKIDRFTGRVQTFIARSTTDYLLPLVDSCTALIGIQEYITKRGSRHIALVFDCK